MTTGKQGLVGFFFGGGSVCKQLEYASNNTCCTNHFMLAAPVTNQPLTDQARGEDKRKRRKGQPECCASLATTPLNRRESTVHLPCTATIFTFQENTISNLFASTKRPLTRSVILPEAGLGRRVRGSCRTVTATRGGLWASCTTPTGRVHARRR
jgi:hypothetical protein